MMVRANASAPSAQSRRRALLFLTLSSAVAQSCRTTSTVRGATQPCPVVAGATAGSSIMQGPSLAVAPPTLLAQRVEALSRSVTPTGARFARYLASGFLTERQSLTTPIDIEAGACVAVVAYASPGIGDLDARVYDEAGELLVEDVEPDSHPTVQLCAQEPRRIYHVVQAFEGDGAFVVAQFDGERRSMDALIAAVGGRPGTAVSTRANSGDGERRLLELRSTLGRRGFVPSSDPMRVHFAAAGRTVVPLQVVADRCFTVAAFADGATPAMRLSVYDSEGNEIARDARERTDVSTQFCPGISGNIRVVLQSSAVGSVVLQSFAADAATFGGGNTLWLGERTMAGVSAVGPEVRLESARARWTGAGFTLGTAQTITLAPSESREVPVMLEANRCSLVGVAMGRGLARLSTALYSEDGELISRGNFSDGLSSNIHCTGATRERALLRIRADAGGGDVQWTVAPGSPPPAWTSGLQRVLLNESLGVAIGPSSDGWVADGPPERLHLTPQALRPREFTLSAGSCARAVVTLGRIASTAILTMRNANGEQLATTRGEGTLRLSYCATESNQVRLETELLPAIEADVVVQRFTRSSSAQSAGRGP